MSSSEPVHAHLLSLLPEAVVGTVISIEPISLGMSGAGVYAIEASRGPMVLRLVGPLLDPSRWAQQLRVLRTVAACGIAPELVHVDESARATVSARVAGAPLAAALADPAQRRTALISVADQLAALHALHVDDLQPSDPVAFARSLLTTQRARTGFPGWAADAGPVLTGIERALTRDARRVLSHNDTNPGNILWDGQRAWLVDWDVAGLSHPFYDLAALAMFLGLDEAAAHGLLARQQRCALEAEEVATFAELRRLAALACGLVMIGLVPDLGVLPAAAPTLLEVYAGMRTGALDLQAPQGRGAFAMALLRVGIPDGAQIP